MELLHLTFSKPSDNFAWTNENLHRHTETHLSNHTLSRSLCSPEHIMEGYISSAVQSLHLIAHVLKQQLVFVQVHLQPASEQAKQELHPRCRDHTLGKTHIIYSRLQVHPSDRDITNLTWNGFLLLSCV